MLMTRRSLAGLSLGALVAPVLPSALARAQGAGTASASGMTVIELFTSQGCSSCPKADALMVELAGAPGMIPLTFPVQIWDYLGWRDTLATPAFTSRQKAYAAKVAGRRVYTPQAIVNGRAHCVGSDLGAIERLATRRVSEAKLVLSAVADGWRLTAALAVNSPPARLVLLPLVSRREVRIGRGENAGRSVTYANVVRDIVDLGALDANPKSFSVARTDLATHGADGFAALIQTGEIDAPGFVLAGALVGPEGIKV